MPIDEHDIRLTFLDVGWDAERLLASDSWLTAAVIGAERIVLVTTATIPGMRHLAVVLDLLSSRSTPGQIVVAVRGPKRRKWPRGVEIAGGQAVRGWLSAGLFVEVPEDRELPVTGLDSRPLPAPLISSASRLSAAPALEMAAPYQTDA